MKNRFWHSSKTHAQNHMYEPKGERYSWNLKGHAHSVCNKIGFAYLKRIIIYNQVYVNMVNQFLWLLIIGLFAYTFITFALTCSALYRSLFVFHMCITDIHWCCLQNILPKSEYMCAVIFVNLYAQTCTNTKHICRQLFDFN